MLPLAGVAALLACAQAAQPSAPRPQAAPLRQLQWGQLNFLHTTDTHGWHGGHLQEPSYSADWGDYISFAKHLHDRADYDGVDVILVDTGDRIEGNGLYDASDPKGEYTSEIFRHQDIDIITSGNHELYKANSSNNEFYKTVPNFKGNYIASNLDIWDEATGEYVPLARRFKKFQTKNQGIRIMAFGFIFNFEGSSNNTVVQRVQDTVKEKWFLDAIKDRNVDLFIVAGHVAIRSEEYDTIYKAIRDAQWDTPIQFFGGHTHIRDAKKYDSAAYAIESGRYMETIGFMSIEGLYKGNDTQKDTQENARRIPKFSRRYIDNNLYSLMYHSGQNDTTFHTELGLNVTKAITQARTKLNLDVRHGCAPKDLWMSRTEIQNEDSIFRWLGEEVIPDQLQTRHKGSKPTLVMTNTGAMRFDVFKGPFTRDTTYLISPFTSGFRLIKNVEYGVAAKLLTVLNQQDKLLMETRTMLDTSLLLAPEQLAIERLMASSNRVSYDQVNQITFNDKSSLTPGYTTKDDLGDDGDDTLHLPISYYEIPPCMQTLLAFPTDGETVVKTVDIIYNAFIEPWVLSALTFLGRPYGTNETYAYMEGISFTTMIADWVEQHWPCEEKDDL